jgi:drug/metabolite transporter (DMT)-like permease
MASKPGDLIGGNFYFVMWLLIAAAVICGFSHTIVESLIHPAYPRLLILYFNAAIVTAWAVLFITQSTLIRARNVQLHQKPGQCALALGVSLPIIAIATGISMARSIAACSRFPINIVPDDWATPVLMRLFFWVSGVTCS